MAEWGRPTSQHCDALLARLAEVGQLIQAHRGVIILLQREKDALEHGLRSAGWKPPGLSAETVT
jgi:hypothetical protein